MANRMHSNVYQHFVVLVIFISLILLVTTWYSDFEDELMFRMNPIQAKYSPDNLPSASHTALIIEGRHLPNKLAFVVSNVQSNLDYSWNILIVSSAQHIPLYKDKIERSPNIDSSRIEYLSLARRLRTSDDYNDVIKNRHLWNHIKGEFVLVFQTDSVLCSKSRHKVESFFQFDFIGGYTPFHEKYFEHCQKVHQCYSNGGLSLRRISSSIDVIDRFTPVKSKRTELGHMGPIESWDEDMYFFEGMRRMGKPMPEDNLSAAQYFAYIQFEGPQMETFGGHKISKRGNTKAFQTYCPEYTKLVNTPS